MTLELLPDEPEVRGLLALMLLVDARRTARTDGSGGLVRLEQQDRGAWDRARIAEGQALMRECLARQRPGPYQLQAAINAVHADAATAHETDWKQIRALYDQWMAIAPDAVVALNRAVAVAEIEGAEAGLRLVEELQLSNYQPFHAVRGELLRRMGLKERAAEAYREAIRLSGNEREREFLRLQAAALAAR
jgi:RNA polymerase sigma-70 factor (ECF subfamily)